MIVVNQAWQTFHWGLNGHISATSLASPPLLSLSFSQSLALSFYQASGQWATNTQGLFRLLDTVCPLLGGRPPGKLILIQNQFSLLSLFPYSSNSASQAKPPPWILSNPVTPTEHSWFYTPRKRLDLGGLHASRSVWRHLWLGVEETTKQRWQWNTEETQRDIPTSVIMIFTFWIMSCHLPTCTCHVCHYSRQDGNEQPQHGNCLAQAWGWVGLRGMIE